MSSTTAYLLYLLFALGATGVYFLLPQGGRPRAALGGIFGGSALALWLVLLATRIGGDETSGYFYLFATVAVAAGARVITHPRPVYSALYFVVVVIAVASLLVLLQAEFLAVALIIIYAGAILVTYLFVIMLAQQPGSPVYDRRAREPLLAVIAGFVLMAAIAGRAVDTSFHGPESGARVLRTGGAGDETAVPGGNTVAIGRLVMTKYVVPLQLGGVLLLISMVGAIAMSRRKAPSEANRGAPAPLGEIGKYVEPF